jgi:tRNA-guanine family transglycosylase
MYDCVYPTRTARFGVALVPGKTPGTLRIRGRESMDNQSVIQEGCCCQPCREGISRARLHSLLKAGNPIAAELITQHNIAYMMNLVRSMRTAVLEDRFPQFARSFVRDQYPGKDKGGDDCPKWVIEALGAAGVPMDVVDA